LIDKSKHGVIASTGFAILRDSKISINRDYLLYVLRSELSLQQMLQRSSGGNYPAITTEELKKVIIPLPPMLIQDKIAENVKARLQRAEQLQGEAKEELKVAKKEIEKGILG
jgi:restriction endonuclease S subunit